MVEVDLERVSIFALKQILSSACPVSSQGLPYPGHVEEHRLAKKTTWAIKELVIEDKGLIGKDLKNQLSRRGVDLQTPLHAIRKMNQKSAKPKVSKRCNLLTNL